MRNPNTQSFMPKEEVVVTKRKLVMAIGLAVAAIGAGTVAAYAAIIDGSGVIHGCYSNTQFLGQQLPDSHRW